MKYQYIEAVERYMEQHQFLEADKVKVRRFLSETQAIDGHLTRNALYYVDRFGMPGLVSRDALGLQNNFV